MKLLSINPPTDFQQKLIAISRIILGLTFFTNFIALYPHINDIWGTNGINFFHYTGSDSLAYSILSSIFELRYIPTVLISIYTIATIASILISIGFFTQYSLIILFISNYFLISLDQVQFSGWVLVFSIFPIYFYFLGANRFYSVDSIFKKTNHLSDYSRYFFFLIKFHLTLQYLGTIIPRLLKLNELNGTDGFYVMSFHHYSRFIIDTTNTFVILVVKTLYFIFLIAELLAPVILWFPHKNRVILLTLLSGHLVMLCISFITWWQLAMISGLILFIDESTLENGAALYQRIRDRFN
jgi:hypothetical protein